MPIRISYTVTGVPEANAMLEELKEKIQGLLGTHVVTVGASIFYAKFVEYGRGPVRPVRAKVLHWDGVFTKYAGPAAPRPFIRPAAATIAGEIPELYQDAFTAGEEIDALLGEKQPEWLALTQGLAPVRTGALRASVYVTVG